MAPASKIIHLIENTAPIIVYVLGFRDVDGEIKPFPVDQSNLTWRIKAEGDLIDPEPQLVIGDGITVDPDNPHICRVQLESSMTVDPGRYKCRLDIIEGELIINSVLNPVVIEDF